MRKWIKPAVLMIMALPILAPHAFAQEADGLKLPPPGTTVMNLSATETQKVPQDLLVASLRIEADEASAAAVQAKINEAMQFAVAQAKKEADVKVTTGAYSVYPYDPAPPQPQPQPYQMGEQRPMRWRGSQSLDLKSLKPDPVLNLAAAMQEKGFAMNNLGYMLSPEKYESIQDDLLVRALGKLRAKADLAARTLDKKSYDMLNVDLSPSGQVYPMYARGEMAMGAVMDKGIQPPVAEAGETDVSLTVSARVLLRP